MVMSRWCGTTFIPQKQSAATGKPGSSWLEKGVSLTVFTRG